MIEPYQWLYAQAQALGYNPAHVGPASVDLCLGDVKVLDKKHIRWSGYSVLFEPWVFYLCSTLECITVPLTHCAFLSMRSSLARRGLGHKMAGFIDPGFTGQITLELETSMPIEVTHGARIVQLIYMRLTETTERPYSGRYLGQRGPTESYREE